MSQGTGRERFGPDEPSFDLALRRLLDGDVAAQRCALPEVLPPTVAVLRVRDLTEPLIGRRCRYLLTDHDDEGNIVDYGWRSDLRIASGPEAVDGATEPCFWIQDEADYYGALSGERDAPRRAAGASRLWVEVYVDQPWKEAGAQSHRSSVGSSGSRSDPHENPNAWLARVVEDPNLPRIIKPIPAREAHSLVGRRAIVVHADGGYEADLRAVDEPTFAHGGDIGVTVIDEGSWYRWSEPHAGSGCSLRTYPVEQVWIEA